MCKFCESFDFSRARTVIDRYGTRLETGLCNGTFPEEEQFKYCPMCGEKLPHTICPYYSEKDVQVQNNLRGYPGPFYQRVGYCREQDEVKCKGNRKFCDTIK